MNFEKVLYLTSDDVYLVHRELRKIKEEFINEYMDLNYVDIKEIKNVSLDNLFETYPMMADKKMIVLNNIKETDDLTKKLLDIPEYCSVVITGELDKRKKLYKFVKKSGVILDISRYTKSQMINWILETMSSNNIKMTKKVAELIIELTGLEDMYYIENEIKKLCQMGLSSISEDTIKKVIIRSSNSNAFQLTDAVTKKDNKFALDLINDLSNQGEYLPMYISLLNKNFCTLHMLKTITEKEVKEIAKIHPYTVKLLKPLANMFEISELENKILISQELDFRIKSGLDPKIALEELILC